MMKVENVSVGYGSGPIVSNVSFTINEDDLMIILGRNGVGKTTLLKGLIGILPIKGNLQFDDENIAR